MGDPKTFPVIPERRRDVPSKPHPPRIPWSVAELAYSVYSARYGSSQTLERLAERGGFHASELDDYLPDWRERASDLTAARAEIERLREALWRLTRIYESDIDCGDPPVSRPAWLAEALAPSQSQAAALQEG